VIPKNRKGIKRQELLLLWNKSSVKSKISLIQILKLLKILTSDETVFENMVHVTN